MKNQNSDQKIVIRKLDAREIKKKKEESESYPKNKKGKENLWLNAYEGAKEYINSELYIPNDFYKNKK